MTLDPAPIAQKAAELMDELEDELPEGAQLEDAVIVVEVSYPPPAEDAVDEDDRWSEVRLKSTNRRSTVVLGMVEIAAEIQRKNDVDED